MEFGSIEREIFIDASPQIVFDVVSSAEHLRQWWPDDARFETTPGSQGEIVFGGRGNGGTVESFTVIDVQPPTAFSFRWTNPADQSAAAGNSLLVRFELSASGGGTLLTMTETGFREMGWEIAVLEENYRDHVSGWDYYLPRIAPYVAGLVSHA